MRADVLGAVIAGGRSTRYGSPKALVTVGGRRIVDRVIAALGDVVQDTVLIANDPELAAAIALPARADVIPDLGALGGIHAALLWAREREVRGVLAVACDMPFVSPSLLARVLELVAQENNADVVAPESGGRRGIEPLCSYYAVTCLEAIESAIARDDRRVIGFHRDVNVVPLARDEVERYGTIETLFLNVNTPAEQEMAERIAVELGV